MWNKTTMQDICNIQKGNKYNENDKSCMILHIKIMQCQSDKCKQWRCMKSHYNINTSRKESSILSNVQKVSLVNSIIKWYFLLSPWACLRWSTFVCCWHLKTPRLTLRDAWGSFLTDSHFRAGLINMNQGKFSTWRRLKRWLWFQNSNSSQGGQHAAYGCDLGLPEDLYADNNLLCRAHAEALLHSAAGHTLYLWIILSYNATL